MQHDTGNAISYIYIRCVVRAVNDAMPIKGKEIVAEMLGCGAL